MKHHIGFDQNAFLGSLQVRDKLIGLILPVHSASRNVSRPAHKQQPAPHLPGTDRHLFSQRVKKKGTRIELQILSKPGGGGRGSQGLFFFLFFHLDDVSPQLVHSSFKHFSTMQTDGCFFHQTLAWNEWWQKLSDDIKQACSFCALPWC